MWRCDVCNFTTDRYAKYIRHIESRRHKTCAFFLSDHQDQNVNDLGGTEFSTEDDDVEDPTTAPVQEENIPSIGRENVVESDTQDEVNNSSPSSQYFSQVEGPADWFPFSSKAEFLLYIFMNSYTHPVSDEVVKFVLFMLEELGVSEIPNLPKLKKKKIGKFNWDEMMEKGTNKENIPYWILKPSQLIKMSISRPDISKALIRKPEVLDSCIKHPANAKKWTEQIDFGEEQNEIPIVTTPINLFLDDTATHKSRRWKALHCIQMQLSGLPLNLRQKQGYINFVGASEKADIMDISKTVVEDIKNLQMEGIESYDAENNKKCIVKSCIDTIVADFNMLAYCCNHMGAAANKYCPRCNADAEHYSSLGTRRTPNETRQRIQRINMRSNERDKKLLRKKTGTKENYNAFWDVIDPHRDIPVGLLHLIPLGIAKSLLIHIIKQLDGPIILKMECHLKAFLPGSQFQDFFQHMSSRQGKDFKEYLQVAPLNMRYAGVSRDFVKMVSSLALIQKKLNMEMFMDEDIDSLRAEIREFHQLVQSTAPSMKRKVKTHLLLHVVEDIQQHGPPKAYQEDAFEKNHGFIRNLIFLENQKARSRDTCLKYVKNAVCTHVICGGFFEQEEEWVQASLNIRNFENSPTILKFLGIQERLEAKKKKQPGVVSMIKRDGNKHAILHNADSDPLLSAMLELEFEDLQNYTYTKGSAVTASNGDLIHAGDLIKYRNEDGDESIGQLKEALIVTPARGQSKFMASLNKTRMVPEKELGCYKFEVLNSRLLKPTQCILNKIPVLHDCKAGNCRVVEEYHSERIEQEIISKKLYCLKHNAQHRIYILNRFSL